ncbi:MAG: thiamine-binding protein [Chromatocurvus sp.]
MTTLTVELSFYPLTREYEQRVIDFIHRLRQDVGVRLQTGGMSTLIHGDHDTVFDLLRDATRDFNAGDDTCIFVAKFLNRDPFESPHID